MPLKTTGTIPNSQNGAAHLPPPWPNPAEYDCLYDEIDPFGQHSESTRPWLEKRIQTGATATAVYQMLPSAMTHEFSGYLTKTRIFYRKGDYAVSRFPTIKACTFHSHPTKLGPVWPDVPSIADVRQFVLGRNRRTITVGRFLLWVWDKSARTLDVARMLAAWDNKNLVKVARRLQAKGTAGWEIEYFRLSLSRIGFGIPNDLRKWATIWPNELRDKFGFKVTIIERDNA